MAASDSLYETTPGGVISGGRFFSNNFVALMGDSLTAENVGLSPLPTFNAATGGKLKLLANCGVSAETISSMVARVNNLYTNANPGMAGIAAIEGVSTLGWIICRAGTNNIRGGEAISGSTSAYTSLLEALGNYATRVVILSVPPLAHVGGNASSIAYNVWLKAYADAHPDKYIFIDDSLGTRLSNGDIDPTCFNVDGVHLNRKGVGICGHEIARVLGPLLLPYPSPVVTDPLDVYPNTNQWMKNHINHYSGVPKTGGIVGALADNMSFNAPSIYGTCEIVPADANDPNTIPWQRISINRATAANTTYIGLGVQGRALTTTDPLRMDSVIDLRCTNLNTDYINSISTFMQGNTGEYFNAAVSLDLPRGQILNRRYVLRNSKKRTGSAANTSMTYYLTIGMPAIFGPLDIGSIDFRCATARG